MTDFEKFLIRLVAAKGSDPSFKKIVGVIAGGGVSLSRLALVPGSSKILGSVWVPYDQDDTYVWIEQHNVEPKVFREQAVCAGAVEELYHALTNFHRDNNSLVAITSALTTSRYRRGENQAYIMTENGYYHRLRLDKLDESVYNDPIKSWVEQKVFYKRQAEDEKVAEVALKLLTGFEEDTLKDLYGQGTLSTLPF